MSLFDPGEPPGQGRGEGLAAGFVRIALEIAYDGKGLSGFAAQPGRRTVAGLLEAALGKLVGEVKVSCAGRTDAGVHASAQVVHFDTPEGGPSPTEFLRAVNRQLAPKIVAKRAALAPVGFHARHSAVLRRYRYGILACEVADPMAANQRWFVPHHLDLAAMRTATYAILGERDFTAFCRRPPGHEGPIMRRLHYARWSVVGAGLVDFELEANAFCHQMVRALVGTMVEVGRGRMDAAAVGRLARSGSRQGAPTLAPAHGLCLVGVGYGTADPFAGIDAPRALLG